MKLEDTIRTIPDYPKPGIMFRDVTTLFANAKALRQAVEAMSEPYLGRGITQVVGIEARGFILGGAIACRLGAGFVPVRKKGKLPFRTLAESYALEYGTDTLEIHEDAFHRDESVLVVDDLIATGGTALAAIALVERAGAHVVGCAFIIDLPELGGSAKLGAAGKEPRSLVTFQGH